MAVFFLDASAMVKYYVREPGSTWIRSLIDADPESSETLQPLVLIAEVSVAEVSSAFSVLHRSGRLRRRARDAVFSRFMRDIAQRFSLATVTRNHFFQAARLTQKHPLKAYDAVQLAVALRQHESLSSLRQPVIFVSGDRTLLTAAKAENLPVDDPFEHVMPEDTTSDEM
jgi:predicted nucleic acid-binding protein